MRLSRSEAETQPCPDFPKEIQTERLVLRQWQESDRDAFAAINADPRVTEHFPSPATREESDELFDRIVADIDRWGFGLYAVEISGTAQMAGFNGLIVPRFDEHFTPCVEICWRLAFDTWGQGLATEGGRAILNAVFERTELTEIVAMTALENRRSERVMQKLGMKRNPDDDFDHPLIDDERLVRHILYRITSAQFHHNP